MNKFVFTALLVSGSVAGFLVPLETYAVSFTADAVQIRNGEFNHARLLWTDNKVRFEYLDQGVAMVQIYDASNKKVIWMDTENKVFLQRDLSDSQAKQQVIRKSKSIKHPCKFYTDAQCTKLKKVTIDGRDAVKWLITFDVEGHDEHIFQWLDKKYGVVLRQENPDGSYLNVTIEEDVDVNGRKTRKIDRVMVTNNNMFLHGTRWYDNDLNVVIRQVFTDGATDELRNIKVEKISRSLFNIPGGYTEIDRSSIASRP